MKHQIVQQLKLILQLLILNEIQFFVLFIYPLQQISKKQKIIPPKQFKQIMMRCLYQIVDNMLEHTSVYTKFL